MWRTVAASVLCGLVAGFAVVGAAAVTSFVCRCKEAPAVDAGAEVRR